MSSPDSRAQLQLLCVLMLIGSMYMMFRILLVSSPSIDCGYAGLATITRELHTANTQIRAIRHGLERIRSMFSGTEIELQRAPGVFIQYVS